MRFSLPEASTDAPAIDLLIGGLLLVSVAVLGLVFFLLFSYIIRYRHKSPIRRGELGEKSFRFEIT